jgi:3-oxo-4-pregnene-20-carboxyl-CoA dehydrogenase beta subunit
VQFSLTETQLAVRGVCRDVLERDPGSWQAWADAGLLGAAIPEAYGGDGLGLAEVGVLLHEVGRRAALLPVLETLAFGVLPVARAGTQAQQTALLPQVMHGAAVLTAAIAEPGDALPAAPRTVLRRGSGGWLLDGRKIAVGYADRASTVLVPATVDPDGTTAVVLLDPHSPGVVLLESRSSRGEREHTLQLTDVPVAESQVLGGPPGSREAAAAAAVLREHVVAGLCLLGDGIVAGARDLTAGYVRDRRQFGRALAEFQAVSLQMADVYIASRTISLAAQCAAWLVGNGLDAGDDLAVAAHWLTVEGPAALHTCQHLHGGVGVDRSYPLHRYYSWTKDVSRALGGTRQSLAAVPVREQAGKNLELTEEQRSLKAELRDYFEHLVSAEDQQTLLTERHGDVYHRVVKQMGSDGWMGVGWPREYGGRGFGEVEQQIFANEASRSDVPLPSVTLQTVGPTLQAFGTPTQKDRFLADILQGNVHFAIGYSEAEAGTDLASLRTTARLVEDDGDPYYLVNGQKMWTTGGHAADYLWLAVRTDPDAPKHKGISVLIMDTTDPGYSWTPIITADGAHHVNATYFNDVRVPADMLVGTENQGWGLITTQLNHERVMLGPAGRLEGLRDRVHDWAARHTAADGRSVLEQADVRTLLAEVTAAFRVNELLNWQVAAAGAAGPVSVADASASKVFASDRAQHLGRALEQVVHRYGDPADPDTGRLMCYLDSVAKRNLVLTFGGGVNEVQRELVSMFGLGLPRVPR